MKTMSIAILAVALAFTGCSTPPPTTSTPTPDPPIDAVASTPAQPSAPSQPSSAPASGPGNNATQRVEAGTARLKASPAGMVVLRGIQAHGGLDAWYASEAIQFRYDYRPTSGKPAKNSVQTVDLHQSRVYHDMIEPAVGTFAWDGERAWGKFEGEAKVPVHFWALTPYYFVGLPFVFADPGVQLELLKDEPDFGLPPCDVVRVTFAGDTGDAPDDYYIAHFARSDGRLIAVRYVVSWKPFVAPRAIPHTPEKLLVFSEFDGVGALTIAKTHTFYALADGVRGEVVTVATVSELKHPAPFDAERLTAPEGAVYDTSLADAQK